MPTAVGKKIKGETNPRKRPDGFPPDYFVKKAYNDGAVAVSITFCSTRIAFPPQIFAIRASE
jgi:hypothetical protein